MTAAHYRDLLLRHWRLIITCTLLVGLGALVGSLFMKHVYQAIAVTRYDGSNTTMQTDVQLATSAPVLSAVASHYPGLSVQQLAGEVSASLEQNTQLLQIIVQDTDPARAVAIANDVAAALVAQHQQFLALDNSQVERQARADITATQAQMDQIAAALSELAPTPANASRIAVLKSDLYGLQQQYSELQAALSQIVSKQADNSFPLRVVNPAQVATLSRPLLPVNTTAGLVFGFLLGVLIVVLRDHLALHVRTPVALFEILQRPILAPLTPFASMSDVPAEKRQEPYRALQTDLEFLGINRPLRSLVVASVTADDRAGVVAANLAYFVAAGGKRTLLVDADLWHPSQGERFGITADSGLSDAVLAFNMSAHKSPLLSRYIHSPTNIDSANLRIMPAGTLPPNPAEVLKSKAMKYLLGALVTSGADMVIFSAPAILGSPGTCALVADTDGVLLVVDLKYARRDQLMRAQSLLAAAGGNILGCIPIEEM